MTFAVFLWQHKLLFSRHCVRILTEASEVEKRRSPNISKKNIPLQPKKSDAIEFPKLSFFSLLDPSLSSVKQQLKRSLVLKGLTLTSSHGNMLEVKGHVLLRAALVLV